MYLILLPSRRLFLCPFSVGFITTKMPPRQRSTSLWHKARSKAKALRANKDGFLRPGKTWSTLNMNNIVNKGGRCFFFDWVSEHFFSLLRWDIMLHFLVFLGCFCLMNNWGRRGMGCSDSRWPRGGWPSIATAPKWGDVMSHTFLKTMTFNISPSVDDAPISPSPALVGWAFWQ